jgi:aryl-alcohol dehydrogenase-like predicted oxidoreductase
VEYININGTDLKSSVVGLGGNKIAALSRDKDEVVSTLNHALDQGINLFDTADDYSYGDSEKLLGKLVRSRRDKVIICSKAGHIRGRAHHVGKFLIPAVKNIVRRWKPLRTTAVSAIGAVGGGANYGPAYIAKSIENSLRRLGTDYLDMFLIHGAGPDDIADGALIDKLERLKDKGMIRHYGVSCARKATPDDVRALLTHKTLSSLQISFNPYHTATLDAALEHADARDTSLVTRDVFYKGDIFGDPTLQPALERHPDRSPAQTAIRFALQENPTGPVIVGATKKGHLNDIIGALSAPALTPDDIVKLRALGAQSVSETTKLPTA